MPDMIDVTGIPPEGVRALESLVAILREKTTKPKTAPSIFDLFGKAPNLRSAEDIAKQIQEERDAWGES